MRKSLPFLLLLLILPAILFGIKQYQNYQSKAAYIPANIIVDANTSLGQTGKQWCGFSQGGEISSNGKPLSFTDITSSFSRISPCFVRIDHIFDIYAKVYFQNQELSIDWSLLDKTVSEIRATGATPFLSLSYMPQAIAKNGEVTQEPVDWKLWQQLIAETVNRYSGIYTKNIPNIYYEVWNEPDLFGGWRISGSKDYLNLYRFAVYGANSVQNANNFYIGGPAVTQPMYTWIHDFTRLVKQEKLRLDFLSWHRYSHDPAVLKNDSENVTNWLIPEDSSLPRFITEYGSDSDNNQIHDLPIDAYHFLASVSYLDPTITTLFTFEIKDGPSPLKQQYWGRWGLYTNEENGLVAKPKYQAFTFLKNLSGERLEVKGNGTYTSATAAKEGNIYQVLVVNYVPPGAVLPKTTDTVPITIKGIDNGIYAFSQKELFDQNEVLIEEKITGGRFYKLLAFEPNKAYLLNLRKTGETADFTSDRRGLANGALLFSPNLQNLSYPSTLLNPATGTIEFQIKLNRPVSALGDETLFKAEMKDNLFLEAVKRSSKSRFGTEIAFGIFGPDNDVKTVSSSIAGWKMNDWHTMAFSWNTALGPQSFIKLYLDGKLASQTGGIGTLDISNSPLVIGGYNGAIDELRISSIDREPAGDAADPVYDDKTVLLRHFDGKLDE